MDEQRKRHLGKGMKPRQSEAIDGVAGEEAETAVSTGMETPQNEGILEVLSNQHIENQSEDPETSPNHPPTPHMVEAEKEVAVTEGFGEAPPEVPSDVFSHLEEVMKASREASGADPAFLEERRVPEKPVESTLIVTEKMTMEEIRKRYPLHKLNGDTGEVSIVPEELEWPERETQVILGELPNGDHAIIVNVREGYWPLVEQQAESDGITPTEWLSIRLSEYLEGWVSPPRNA